jgi:methylated-DNA-protein-cysteine methyltransferase-like protein
MMQELLEKENLLIKNDAVQDFKKYYWDPTVELSM